MKTKFIITCLLVFSSPAAVTSRPASTDRKYVITNYNITFAPDLSNRVNINLYKRPLQDVELLKAITGNLYPSILRTKRSQNQKDKLLVDFVNKGLIGKYRVATDKLFLDFGRFPNQLTRIQYLLNNHAVKPTFRQDVNNMVTEFNRVYRLAANDNVGADIWTYLDQGINDRNVLEDENPVVEDGIVCVNHYRNILILPTDGYIEAGIFGKGFDLSQETINKFRKAFLSSGEGDLAQFYKKAKAFHIKPVKNERLKNIEILVLELYDRSLTKSGSATIHPTDMEIIKVFWTGWLRASGVKRFELHPYANSKNEAENILLKFLDVNKIAS